MVTSGSYPAVNSTGLSLTVMSQENSPATCTVEAGARLSGSGTSTVIEGVGFAGSDDADLLSSVRGDITVDSCIYHGVGTLSMEGGELKLIDCNITGGIIPGVWKSSGDPDHQASHYCLQLWKPSYFNVPFYHSDSDQLEYLRQRTRRLGRSHCRSGPLGREHQREPLLLQRR